MTLTVLGILIISALGTASELLFRVDIVIPQTEGRNEMDDIEFIQRTLSEITGVNVFIAKKAFDNQHVILVVAVEEICGWSSLTSAFTERGFRLSVTPLQSYRDYALELGVNASYDGIDEIRASEVVYLYNVTFHDKGMSTDDYVAMVKTFFEEDARLQLGDTAVCYGSYGELPLRLMYFGIPLPTKKLEEIYQHDRLETKASVVISKLQRLDIYTDMC